MFARICCGLLASLVELLDMVTVGEIECDVAMSNSHARASLSFIQHFGYGYCGFVRVVAAREMRFWRIGGVQDRGTRTKHTTLYRFECRIESCPNKRPHPVHFRSSKLSNCRIS